MPSLQAIPSNAFILDVFHVDQIGIAIPNAVIFHSRDADPKRGRRYAVLLVGIKDARDQPPRIPYTVEFF